MCVVEGYEDIIAQHRKHDLCQLQSILIETLFLLVHLAASLGHTGGDEERHGAAHSAEVEEEAAGAELGEDEAGGLHRHEDHQEVGGDGGSLHHGLQLGAEPLG